MEDYFIFDSTMSTDKSVILKEYSPIFLPSKNKSFIPIMGRNGSVSNNDKSFGDIVIPCSVSILGDNEEDILRKVCEINAWLVNRGKLSFWDMLDKYYIGELTGEIPMSQHMNWNDLVLSFRCEPLKYGSTITYPLTASSTFINSGTYETVGVITLVLGTSTELLKVTSATTGKAINLDHSFVSGDVVVIDCVTEKVTKNGYLINSDLTLDSDYIELPVGINTLTINTNVTSGNVTYIERWM